ncbi:MAG TPA: MFS transporter [Pseudonocardia sp.]|jgi:EmrB/QacA subfamily drug resistance transporter|uniref:MFS transporter n=1 Tax=Pseudonocardia sp. TaxID=60912 RepID=UPI002B4B405B|nr:MFS transporter [Pseudonocardia sp.]HLU57904.1 MFS transporter [Pseudonocardia sp.]
MGGTRLGLVATPLVVGTFASTIANTLVNVPLATIVADLDAPIAGGALVVVAFNVLCALMLPIGGWLGDRFGRRRLFLVSMAVVAFGAAGAALSPNLAVLVAFRAVQGVGGALVLPTVLALLTSAAGPARRGRAVSWWAAANGAGQAAGPTVGGLVTDALGWRAVFAVIIPFAVVAFAGGLRWVTRTPPRPTRLDRAGVLTLTTGAGLLLVAASAVPTLGATSPLVWAAAAAGVLGLVAFVLVERRRADPFIPPSLLVEPRFARSSVAALCQMFCLTATLVTVPLHLTAQAGTSAAVAGLVVVALPLAMTLLAPLAGLLTERWSPRRALRLGLLALGLAELGLAALIAGGHGAGVPLVAAVTAIGVGIAFTQTPATAGASRGTGGAGLGLFNMLRFVGAALGGATVAVVLDGGGGHATVAVINGAVALLALGVAFLGRNPEAAAPVAAWPPSRKHAA